MELIHEKQVEGKTSPLDFISVLEAFDEPQVPSDKIYRLLSLLSAKMQKLICPGEICASLTFERTAAEVRSHRRSTSTEITFFL